MVFDTLRQTADVLRAALADLEPERLSGPDAATLLERFAEIEKLAAAGKLLAARRVESSNVWRRDGHRSAAAHVADTTGTGLGPAINTLQTARRLGSLPATEDAVRDGSLSESQAREIADAASVDPAAEQELVDAAQQNPMNVLKLRCRRVKAAGRDPNADYERIRKARYLKHWTDNQGAVRFDARLTPDDGARLIAAVRAEADRLAASARRNGRDETDAAHAADALVGLATLGPTSPAGRGPGSGRRPTDGSCRSGPGAMVHVRVDHAALVRGHVEAGELCEIPGVGPIPVATARALAADAILSVLVTDGVDVLAVAHAGRNIPAAVRRALVERDPTCVVPGCDVHDHLEIDHLRAVIDGGPTELANLARLCRWHHYLKTFHRHVLERHDGAWSWQPPESWATVTEPRRRPARRGRSPAGAGSLFDGP